MGSCTLTASRLLFEGCGRLGLELSERQLGALEAHIEYIAKWNRRVNLTAILDAEQMVVRHVLDSLAIVPYIRGQRLLDIGSGGGFPGLPLAITRTDIETVLLDSSKKKIEFLGHVVSRLELNNVKAVHGRMEDYRPAGPFHTLAARAVGSLERVLQQSQALCQAGSRLLVMKGKNPEPEIRNLALEQVRELSIVELQVPYLNAGRSLVVIEF